MKIGIVSPNFPMRSDPHRAVYVYEAARRLAELADVRVFCPIAEYVGPFARLGPKAADQQGFTVSGVEVEYFGYPAIPVLSRATNGMVCARRLLPRVRAFSPDLLLCYWIFPEGYAGLLVGQRLGIPVIVRSIGSDLNRQSDVISRRFIRRTLQQAQFVLTASEQLRRRAIQFGATPERSRAVLNGCDASIFYPADKNAARAELQVPADARLVVFVGRVTREKGIFELLEAARFLAEDYPNLMLCYIGVGPHSAELSRMIAASNRANAKMIAGCPPATVARWMAAADTVALASYAEGCPNVVLEALSCGRPVVATPVGCVPEIVTAEAGALVPIRDAGALAAGLRSVFDREWDATRLAGRFRRTWQDAAGEIYAICRHVLAEYNPIPAVQERDTVARGR